MTSRERCRDEHDAAQHESTKRRDPVLRHYCANVEAAANALKADHSGALIAALIAATWLQIERELPGHGVSRTDAAMAALASLGVTPDEISEWEVMFRASAPVN